MNIALFGNFTETQLRALQLACPSGYRLITAGKNEWEKVKEADYICCRGVSFTAETFEKLPKLKFISKWGVGYNKIDIQSAGLHHIPVSVCIGGNAEPVAELTVELILDVLRGICKADRELKVHAGWERDAIGNKAYLLHGKKVGLIGFGNIAKKVAKILIHGFGCETSYYDVVRASDDVEKSFPIQFKPLESLMKESDVVSIHVPLMESTAGMINARLLSMMKPTSILVNTARGGVVDEKALIQKLKEKAILGAGLDSYEEEPLPRDAKILQLDNVVTTPHIGGTTVDNDGNMAQICMKNVIDFDRTGDMSARAIINQQYLK